MTVETWTDIERIGRVHVAVILDDGSRHKRILNAYEDGDYRDLRIAGQFWRHGEMVAGIRLTEHFTREHRDAAVLVDQCLAVEQLFPHLRERLPA